MQTFLPTPDFAECARLLDYRRLGKQRVEVVQILKAIAQGPTQCVHCLGNPKNRKTFVVIKCDVCNGTLGLSTPWFNHPATQMWKDCLGKLVQYGTIVCREWKSRGFSDNCAPQILELAKILSDRNPDYFADPVWLGDERLHASHRSNLLRKDPKYYGQFGWKESTDLPYFWPTKM